ncbi:hypothetical protein, partial [Pseudomonas sp. SIMBA_067]|uniref:hypothetical protein n=1 Tax=Pseudomonas sp. SIMBA_067 TaxID=3085807 RepID=UPI0039788951
LLILAREVGHQLELSDIEIEPLLPASLTEIQDIEQFMQRLPELDNAFAARVAQAQDEGKVLRYVGVIEEGGICKVKIDAVD